MNGHKNINQWIMTLGSVIMVICSDLISKYLFYDKNLLADSKIFQSAFNTGISRSLPINTIFVIVVTFFFIVFMFLAYNKKRIGKRGFVFLVGGSIGNLIDRIYLGGVRDFIYLVKRFPIFNLADCFISIGAGSIIIKEFLKKKNKS